jgi:hypothetical protein
MFAVKAVIPGLDAIIIGVKIGRLLMNIRGILNNNLKGESESNINPKVTILEMLEEISPHYRVQ